MKRSVTLLGALLVAIAGATGCALMGASIPGGIAVVDSSYDGTREIYMNPGWANNDLSGSLKIGARKNSKMAPGEAILIVRNDMIRNFSSGENFFVKIDGKERRFSPISAHSECAISTKSDTAHCSQEYYVEMAYFEQMIASKDVQFKLLLRDGLYSEGSLKNSGVSTARSGIQDFLAKVQQKLAARMSNQSAR